MFSRLSTPAVPTSSLHRFTSDDFAVDVAVLPSSTAGFFGPFAQDVRWALLISASSATVGLPRRGSERQKRIHFPVKFGCTFIGIRSESISTSGAEVAVRGALTFTAVDHLLHLLRFAFKRRPWLPIVAQTSGPSFAAPRGTSRC